MASLPGLNELSEGHGDVGDDVIGDNYEEKSFSLSSLPIS